MRTAFNDFFYEKRGIYGVLHVMILLLSLFLIVDISIVSENAVLDLHVLHRRFHIGVFPVKR